VEKIITKFELIKTMTITNNIRIASFALAAFVLVATAFAVAPAAQAADLGSDGEWVITGATPVYDYGGSSVDSSGEWMITSATPIYDSDYFGGAPCGGTCGGGFSFSGGGGWSPSFFGGGATSFYTPPSNSSTLVTNNGNSYINAPTNVNAPTTITNSGNTSISYPAQQPQIVYNQPPVYTQPPIYTQPPVYYPPTPVYPMPPVQPYVSLTAVPYTGLELGPLGTALYWSFLVLWCLAAAYLIVVKKVQNKIVSGLSHFLFGTPAVAAGTPTHTVRTTAHTAAKIAIPEDTIDPFIASQIHRNK
jgi:hypothetical protein